jgi:uncharacterized protein YdaT
MPWTGKGFKKHNSKLSGSEATHAARIANSILKRTGDEGMAIATANKIMGRKDHDPIKHGYTKEE